MRCQTQPVLEVLEPLAAEHPRSAPAHLELAMARSAAGRGNDALVSLRRATELNASSEQVRQPIFRDGVDRCRHYEPWLGPLKRALGPVLESYPAVPTYTPSTIQQIVDQS
jgi:hypothetical protein